ncbi:MAG: hypothetical protein ACLU4J_08710 [Butyricimonas paravirosa]
MMNLVTQLVDKGYGLSAADLSGKTNDELNTLFVNARIAKFRAGLRCSGMSMTRCFS